VHAPNRKNLVETIPKTKIAALLRSFTERRTLFATPFFGWLTSHTSPGRADTIPIARQPGKLPNPRFSASVQSGLYEVARVPRVSLGSGQATSYKPLDSGLAGA